METTFGTSAFSPVTTITRGNVPWSKMMKIIKRKCWCECFCSAFSFLSRKGNFSNTTGIENQKWITSIMNYLLFINLELFGKFLFDKTISITLSPRKDSWDNLKNSLRISQWLHVWSFSFVVRKNWMKKKCCSYDWGMATIVLKEKQEKVFIMFTLRCEGFSNFYYLQSKLFFIMQNTTV